MRPEDAAVRIGPTYSLINDADLCRVGNPPEGYVGPQRQNLHQLSAGGS